MRGAWSGRLRRSLAAALILVELGTACMGWHTVGPTPQAVLREKPRKSVRVTLDDGATVVITDPRLVGDSVVGRAERRSSQKSDTAGAGITAVPTERVRQIEVRRVQPVPTTLALLGGALLVSALACSASDCLNFDWSEQGSWGD